MEAVIDRKQTAFRLSCDLLDKLREAATRENRSLNNYVESVLMDVVYNNPNIILFALSTTDVSNEAMYICVVASESCPIPSLITDNGTFFALAALAHE